MVSEPDALYPASMLGDDRECAEICELAAVLPPPLIDWGVTPREVLDQVLEAYGVRGTHVFTSEFRAGT